MTRIVLKIDEYGIDLVKKIQIIGTVARFQGLGFKVTKGGKRGVLE